MAFKYQTLPPIVTQPLFPQPVTALAFDPVSDTLWTGNNTGNVVAFYGTSGTRGVVFPVSGDLAVKKLLVADQYVRGLGTAGRGVGSWSKGGMNKWFYKSAHTVTTFSNTISASSNIAVSTSVPELALVNSTTGTLVRQSPSPSLITHLVSSHTLLISGSSDGCIRTHDVRIGRSGSSAESSVKAHTKGFQGLEVNGNNIFTIGWSVRQSRPFPDPIVKVYDLRNFKALPPVSFSAGPGFINAMPRKSNTIVITSSRGLINIVDINNPGDGGEFYQLDVPSYISSVAVSPTGVYLAFGDAEGNINLMSAAEEGSSVPFNGFEGQPVEWPDVAEHIPDIGWDESIPLNSVGMPHYDSLLLSSWTPKFLPPNLLYPPPPKVPSQIEQTMKYNENIAYASMPKELQGRRNVVSTGPRRDAGRFKSGKTRAESAEPETPVSENPENIPRPYRNVDIQYSRFGVEDFDFSFYNKTEYSGLESHIINSYTNCLVQTLHYSIPIRQLAKSHILTNCNLEHCLLCELGFVMKMLEDARGINCQASNFCKALSSLANADNRAFLVDYGAPPNGYSDMIQGFHRFLTDRLCKEGNYLPNNPAIVPNSVLTPTPGASAPQFAPPITQLMAFDAKQVIVCRNCKAKRYKESITHILDLTYPKTGLSGIMPSTDFETIVQESLIRANTHKATCSACKQFATFDSRKAISSKDLPPILAMNTCVYQPGIASHKLWLDTRQGPFLKPFIEVKGQVDGVDDLETVTYELMSLIAEIRPEDKPMGNLVSIVKVPESERFELNDPWVVFNDFVVTNVSERDALSFPGAWKIPSILYYERVDMRSKLDFTALPRELDLSILSNDINIAARRDKTAIKHELLGPNELPKPGTVVAIDAEFVSMQQEESEFRSDGTKKVIRPARLGLARVSVLRGDGAKFGVPFIDDHINTSEIIVDYLTEFSGIKHGDLDPTMSRHTLVPLKLAYKKLRLLVDLGCFFIGHGLTKDFRIINIFVPPERVLDTVDIYYIPSRQRRISLRFLSWFVLKQNIQTGEHDSIEDARCALLLHKKFHEYEGEDVWDEKLEEIYKVGKEYNWKPPPLPGSPTATPMLNASPPTVSMASATFGMMQNLNNMNLNMNAGMHLMQGNMLQGFPQEFQLQNVNPLQHIPTFIQPNFNGFSGQSSGSPFQQNWRRRHR